MDLCRVHGTSSSERRTLSGSAGIGKALAGAGSMPLRRPHMHLFFGAGGKHMLPSMRPTPALLAIVQDRTSTIYTAEPWKAFWKARENYRSPPLPESMTAASAGHAPSRPAAPEYTRPASGLSSAAGYGHATGGSLVLAQPLPAGDATHGATQVVVCN
jgi:hypothetical protein